MLYHLQDPYPDTSGIAKNSYYARLLLNAYSGGVSEMTAVSQYIYHHLETTGEVSQTLRGIAIVEMHHLHLLGTCISQLGIQPRFYQSRNGRPHYWSARNVSYGSDARSMIRADIQGEYDAIDQYNSISKHIREPRIQALLMRIVEDERMHLELLENLLTKV